MRRMLLFFFSLFCLPTVVFAGVGDVDNRYYVTDEMWQQHPYNKFVLLRIQTDPYIEPITKRQLYNETATCTGQYVSKNLILSAAHCIEQGASYEIENSKMEYIPVSLVWRGRESNSDLSALGDWAVWKIEDPQYYTDDFFDISVPLHLTPVINAGWGDLRILKNDEINQIKEILIQIKENLTESTSDTHKEFNSRLADMNIPPVDNDIYRLKVSNCYIVFDECTDNNFTNIGVCENKKIHKPSHYPNMLSSTCDTWSGNSGGGYISRDGKVLYGIHSSSIQKFGPEATADLTSSQLFNDKLKDLIKQYDSENGNAGIKAIDTTPVQQENSNPVEIITAIASNTGTDTPLTEKPKETTQITQQAIEEQAQKVQDLDDSFIESLHNVGTDTPLEEVLNLVSIEVEYKKETKKLEQLKQAYEKAKEKEQSTANKTLTALTTAATGIGGMQLAQGLAEQSADKDAEADMATYIETMRCTYGEDKQVKAGTEEIELPGANDQTLVNLRGEYLALSADLKERKEALGMKPGIESEEILDRANSGLYDDETIGISSGNYESLYRAQALVSEEAQAKIDEEKGTSQKRVIAGGVLSGVGVVGGAVGNTLINGKSEKTTDSQKE